jgi:hypothetical protein
MTNSTLTPLLFVEASPWSYTLSSHIQASMGVFATFRRSRVHVLTRVAPEGVERVKGGD